MNFWEIVLPPVITILATAFVGLVTQAIVAGAKYLIPLLKEQVGTAQFELWRSTADLIVRAVEQSPAFAEFTGPEKKQKAMMEMANWFENKGVPVTVELIDKLIEAAVQEMNGQVGEIAALGFCHEISKPGILISPADTGVHGYEGDIRIMCGNDVEVDFGSDVGGGVQAGEIDAEGEVFIYHNDFCDNRDYLLPGGFALATTH